MSLLNFDSSGHMPKGEKKSLKIFLGIGALVGVVAIGSTLAASINLNGGGPVEFGQGVTQTVACDSDGITLRPESAFANVQGGGSFLASRIVVSDVDSSTGGCSGKRLTIRSYDNSSSTPIASIVVTVIAFSPWFTIPGINGVTLDDVSSSSFTITIDPSALPIEISEVSRFTIESRDTVYSVGDIGPGGGTIFYVSDSEFSEPGSVCNFSCRYFEWAPHDWSGDLDPSFPWSTDTDGIADATASGFANTQRMLTSSVESNYDGDTTGAAFAASQYAGTGNTSGQWFLPSIGQLQAMYNSTAYPSGLFSSGYYWSSSEQDDENSYAGIFGVDGGYFGQNYKYLSNYVRPIRAF
jgi:hypothetical protein